MPWIFFSSNPMIYCKSSYQYFSACIRIRISPVLIHHLKWTTCRHNAYLHKAVADGIITVECYTSRLDRVAGTPGRQENSIAVTSHVQTDEVALPFRGCASQVSFRTNQWRELPCWQCWYVQRRTQETSLSIMKWPGWHETTMGIWQ